MKRLILLIIPILLLCSCSKESIELKKYNLYIKELETNENSTNIPFDINIDLSKFTNEEYMYKVIIDNPKEELKNIEALIIHDKDTKDIFPSSGIFDEKYNLIPNNIDKDNNNAKGIILIGYIKENTNITFKVLVKYEDKDNKTNTIIYSTKI